MNGKQNWGEITKHEPGMLVGHVKEMFSSFRLRTHVTMVNLG